MTRRKTPSVEQIGHHRPPNPRQASHLLITCLPCSHHKLGSFHRPHPLFHSYTLHSSLFTLHLELVSTCPTQPPLLSPCALPQPSCYCLVSFDHCQRRQSLIIASISPPAWQAVNFLTARSGGTETVFGVFGQCVRGGSCSSRSVGYDLMLGGNT